ncbi:kinase-like domain-containing protein [Trichoderma chlorosporum]
MPAIMVEETLPTLPIDITANWLGSKLGRKINTIKNTHSVWGTASKLIFAIEYDKEEEKDGGDDYNAEMPTSVCVKGCFSPTIRKTQPWIVRIAQRETKFYLNLAPHLNGVTVPKSWWAGESEDQAIIIMTDLASTGGSFPAEVDSYPVEMVKKGITQLARLHAQFWGQREEDYSWFRNDYDPVLKGMCVPWSDIVREPGRPPLPANLMDGDLCNEALDRYFTERNPRFRTLLHGDAHIGNTYFTADNDTGFLDWAAFHFGSCFHDVAYYVTSMLLIEDRRAHEMEILDYYIEALQQSGGPRLDRHKDPEVMIEYRRSFMANVIWIISPKEVQSKERIVSICERTVAAFEDHRVIDSVLSQPKPATT